MYYLVYFLKVLLYLFKILFVSIWEFGEIVLFLKYFRCVMLLLILEKNLS